jgi:tetratricopeptide (TPR) repeat protein
VIAASLVLLALVAGAVGTTLGLIEARRQTAFAIAAQQAEAERTEGERLAKLDAEAKKAEAEQAQARAEAGEKLAEDRLVEVATEKQIAKAVKDFLQTKLLAQADTTAQADALLKAGGMAGEAKFNPTILELLDRAALELAPEKIETNFPNQPLVQAEILRTVGETYCGVGEAAKALPFLTRSVDLFSRHLGSDHKNTLDSMNNLAITMESIGDCYRDSGKVDEAIAAYREAARLDPEHRIGLYGLAHLYRDRGRLDEAIEEFAKQVELDPKDAETRYMLADCLRYRGRFSDAVAEYRKVIELDPTYEVARRKAVWALMGASDLDGAIEISPPYTGNYQRLTALAALRPKLDELASGTTDVSTFEEARKLTELAVTDKRYAVGAKAYQVAVEAIGADPHLIKTHNGCYHAQCAVLAGTGADPTYPSAEKQATMRRLGLEWLTNERDAWKADLAKTPKKRSDARFSSGFTTRG